MYTAVQNLYLKNMLKAKMLSQAALSARFNANTEKKRRVRLCQNV